MARNVHLSSGSIADMGFDWGTQMASRGIGKTWIFGLAAGLAVSCSSPAQQHPELTDSPLAQVAPALLSDLSPAGIAAADPFLWLEEVNGARALDWVRQQNARTDAALRTDARYDIAQSDARAILTAQDRTPTPTFRAGGIDSFWQDQTQVRGVWRHATLDSYRSGEPAWRTVLDIDALAKSENANWIYKGASCLDPEETRCLVNLSDGGKDAVVVREFDTATKQFVADGFRFPEGKHRIAWLDIDTLLVATDFGEGSLTESGYPFIVKSLKRGQGLEQASEIYRGAASDGGYGVSPRVLRNGRGEILSILVTRPLDTFRSETWEIVDGRAVKLNLPSRVNIRGALSDSSPARLVFTIEEAWSVAGRVVESGALMAVQLAALRAPSSTGDIRITNGDLTVFEPDDRQSVEDVAVFDDRVAAAIYDNVRGQVLLFDDKGKPGGWISRALPAPENSAVRLGSASRGSQRVFYSHEGFLTPPTLSLADAASATAAVIKTSPARFDASTHVVKQFEATSSDGVKIPYFVTRPKDAPSGGAPTLMFGYGGFQLSYPPAYKPELGKLWLERGGAYVVANIRGGGEFGPAWHQAALKQNRQLAFDDFAAVAADLVARKITSPRRLAIYGRSNGGVLTSVTLTQRPHLIGGAVIESPLVDMLRYHDLPPGASWIGEYGDPRIREEAEWIARYSAYQQVRSGMDYPEVYITTNTRDDRVHPGHARKFAARLQAAGYPALYYENTDGGHSNDSDPVLNAERWARHYVYLYRRLMD